MWVRECVVYGCVRVGRGWRGRRERKGWSCMYEGGRGVGGGGEKK